MKVDQFDFYLPDDRIALHPAQPRDSARMLVVFPDGTLQHACVRDLPLFLNAGDALVANDTKVLAARLRGRRIGRGESEPKIEVLLHRRQTPSSFLAFTRPARKLAVGDLLKLGDSLTAMVTARAEGGEVELQFELRGAELDDAIASQGEMPLPPYILSKRKLEDKDAAAYQTMFAARTGSVAAPTAGLHFTPDLVARLMAKGIAQERITLHVGPGTFLPVSVVDTKDHRMHAEWAEVAKTTADRLNETRARGGRIAAVGTTSLRTLESAATSDGRLLPFCGKTDIFITPPCTFRTAEVLLTNFHLPRSTLFMLVCAFVGTDVMLKAYAEAIGKHYRFYSYGDACLLFRQQ